MTANMFSVSINLALTAFNICFSLHMKRKEAPLWWVNIPVAVLCFAFAIFTIILMIG